MRYTADFETTTHEEDCRVWAWAVCTIDEPHNVIYGNTIETFMQQCRRLRNASLYFHNLKFDGYFIVDYLLKNGYKYVEKLKTMPKTFTASISDTGLWYTITINFTMSNKLTIIDSLKILQFSVEQVAKTFKLDCKKLELDYEAFRPIGHELTAPERDYIKNDVLIMAKALKKMFDKKLTKITIASDAMAYYKGLWSRDEWKEYYPVLGDEADGFIRKAYRGGFTYVNPIYQGLDIHNMITLDVNSLYPSVMYNELLPCRQPRYYKGGYTFDERYPLYIQRLRCNFEVKEGMLPTIQLKNNSRFSATEYITEAMDEPVTLYLTSVDLGLFLKHYNVYNLEFTDGYKFVGEKGLFTSYIDHWMAEKEKATIECNAGLRQISKLMLNSLYGKFGKKTSMGKKYPILKDDTVHLRDLEPEYVGGIYIPVAAFITAYARKKTIESAQENIDRFVYADTDSLHLIGTDEPKGLDIHPTKLGAWKLEESGYNGRYLRPKTYIHYNNVNEIELIRGCGLPAYCHKNVTLDNFHVGVVYQGKLRPKPVPGGVILESTDFTIR